MNVTDSVKFRLQWSQFNINILKREIPLVGLLAVCGFEAMSLHKVTISHINVCVARIMNIIIILNRKIRHQYDKYNVFVFFRRLKFNLCAEFYSRIFVGIFEMSIYRF